MPLASSSMDLSGAKPELRAGGVGTDSYRSDAFVGN